MSKNIPTDLNNHRLADHKCYDCNFGVCVKFNYKGYEISLAADGQDTAIYSDSGMGAQVAQIPSTNAESVVAAVLWIDDNINN